MPLKRLPLSVDVEQNSAGEMENGDAKMQKNIKGGQMEKIKISDGNLVCPHCGSDYISHHQIDAFERSEDAENGLHIAIDGEVRVNSSMTGNPSSRRHGLIIKFSCEGCNNESILSIAQHKGTTEIKFS